MWNAPDPPPPPPPPLVSVPVANTVTPPSTPPGSASIVRTVRRSAPAPEAARDARSAEMSLPPRTFSPCAVVTQLTSRYNALTGVKLKGVGVKLKGVRSGVERRRGASGSKPRDPGRRETNERTPGEKVLKE